MVAIVLLITFALVALVVVTLRVGTPAIPEREPSSTVDSPPRGPTDVPSRQASAAELRRERTRGVLLGLLVSPLVGFPLATLMFTQPALAMVAMTAWVFGPYVHLIVALRRAPRVKARALGIALGHSVAVVALWFAVRQFFAGLDVGIGGG